MDNINLSLTQKNCETLRELAQKYMEIAALPVHKEKLRMWKRLNSNAMERPMVLIDQLPWNEINTVGELTCDISDPYWRRLELSLRQTIYKWKHFPVDMIVEPFITIPALYSVDRYGLNIDEEIIKKGEMDTISSHHYKNQFLTEEDIEKIKDIHITVDNEANKAIMEAAETIFCGAAPIIMEHGVQFHLGLWDFIAQFMGVDDIYFDLIDRPEFIHKIMRRITDATLNGIEEANRLSFHNDIAGSCHCSYTYNDILLPDFGKGKGSLSKNSWAYGMAQLFTSVSPEVTREFEIPYISKIAEKFGMIYYGCCERLDDRIEILKKIPNLKKLSCSPWSKREAFCEKVGGEYIVSVKPTPAFLADVAFDEAKIKDDLLRSAACAKEYNVNMEIILKDISTVNNSPERLQKWSRLAMDIMENY